MKHTVSIKSNDLFARVYRKGKRSYHKFFVLHYLPNGTDGNRLGIHVGKKVGKAVRRNRVKRLVRESYRLSEDKLLLGYDLVISAREDASAVDDFKTADKAMFHLFRCASLHKSVALLRKSAGNGK